MWSTVLILLIHSSHSPKSHSTSAMLLEANQQRNMRKAKLIGMGLEPTLADIVVRNGTPPQHNNTAYTTPYAQKLRAHMIKRNPQQFLRQEFRAQSEKMMEEEREKKEMEKKAEEQKKMKALEKIEEGLEKIEKIVYQAYLNNPGLVDVRLKKESVRAGLSDEKECSQMSLVIEIKRKRK
jgi:hypothetical protein